MAITNTVEDGGDTTKDVKGDRGGPKIYIYEVFTVPHIFRTDSTQILQTP
jgi:hypothetical protein